MPPKKELCRNFQRGSCQYGAQCKFLHASQLQPKPNPFGFGTQTGVQFHNTNAQQQKQNPFGFGVQNIGHTRGANDYGSKQSQFKPFENKWTRTSTNSGSSPALRQSDNQPSTTHHKCTDPESCKRQIIDDFENEKPLWKLTCYGHSKSGPCDVVGDTSYEELRLAAYNDAKNGLSFQSIVERERGLFNSKLLEFERLLHNPNAAQPNLALASQTQTPRPTLMSQNGPPLVSSFVQLGAALNTGLTAQPNNAFGQLNLFQNVTQTPSAYGMNNFSGNAGPFGSQLPVQAFGNAFASSAASFGNSGTSIERNPFSTSSASTLVPLPFDNQTPSLLDGPKPDFSQAGQSNVSISSINSLPSVKGDKNNDIWLKEWKPGEIPEEAPPDECIF